MKIMTNQPDNNIHPVFTLKWRVIILRYVLEIEQLPLLFFVVCPGPIM